MAEDLKDCIPVGGELGTSTSKFCAGNDVIAFSSVVGDALTDKMEKTWRIMNRSADKRWIHNLSLYDDKRNSWRYIGAMTRNSAKVNWYTGQGAIQNYDDAYLGILAGLFCLHVKQEEMGEEPLKKVSLGFGLAVKLGEDATEKFFSYLKERLKEEDGKKYLIIKAKNAATEEIRELKINLVFTVIQYQAYGAYMALLFKKYDMKVFNTYVIDIGHGTWIKLPIIDNEADINLSDSFSEGIYTITQNISTVIFESSRERFKIPEQRLMEKLPLGDYKIEVPGVGIYDFSEVLFQQADMLSERIMQQVKSDIASISRRGKSIDYFTIIGGGSHLLFDRLSAMIAEYYGWSPEMISQRIIKSQDFGFDPRYINCVGFMLLARDQIALEMDKEVDTKFELKRVTTDYSEVEKQ